VTKFFIGLEHPSVAWPFANVMLSINTVRGRLREIRLNNWILDSGAFTEISTHGKWRSEPETYAAEVNQWKNTGKLLAAVSQDMMCEPFILEKTGLTVQAHQELTIARYIRIVAATDVYVLPVIQGFTPAEYAFHVEMYGDLLKPGQWVGVGSICKRNTAPEEIKDVLDAIKSLRPDLKLHGFGIKITALKDHDVRDLLETADSMAWSLHARKNGRPKDPREALRYAARIETLIEQPLFVQPRLLQWWR
jgi:hypothetical protein